MNLSATLRQEILDMKYSGCCKLAFLSGIVRGIGSLDFTLGGFGLTLTTKNLKLFQKTFDLLKGYVGEQSEALSVNNNFNDVYVLKLSAKESKDILDKIQITKDSYELLDYPYSLVEKECCFKCFLKGILLSASSLILPFIGEEYYYGEDASKKVKCYNLEINLTNPILAENISARLSKEADINFKSREKKNNNVLYIKDKELISDIFAYLGLTKTVLLLQDFIVLQSAKNTANRKKNCDMANMEKTLSAAMNQIVAINRIISEGRFEKLNPELQLTATLRKEFPDITFEELRNKFPKEITKSCLNHRLRKLIELSNKKEED